MSKTKILKACCVGLFALMVSFYCESASAQTRVMSEGIPDTSYSSYVVPSYGYQSWGYYRGSKYRTYQQYQWSRIPSSGYYPRAYYPVYSSGFAPVPYGYYGYPASLMGY